MIRLRRLTPTICAFHLGFSLVVRNLCNDGAIGTEPLSGHTWLTETMAEQSGISPVISRMLVYWYRFHLNMPYTGYLFHLLVIPAQAGIQS